MRYPLSKILFISILISFFSTSVFAGVDSIQEIPASIKTYLGDKHPGAEDISVQKKKHFGKAMYEVKFTKNVTDENNKTAKQEFVELFRTNGDFFTSAYVVDQNAFNVISDAAHDRLKSRYPGYKIIAMRMIDNPNGVGNEYEVEIQVAGKLLNATLNDEGEVINEAVE